MSDTLDSQHIYENVGEVLRGDEDDDWGSSEFEEFEESYEEDQLSIGAQSQNSREGANQGRSKAKNLFRRKVPSRLSWGKPAADVQSVVSGNWVTWLI